jgi:tetratricopeptide (TPR) repeat protein
MNSALPFCPAGTFENLATLDRKICAPMSSNRPWQKIRIILLFVLLSLLAPQAHGHGDLYLRLKDLTNRIDSAKGDATPLYLERGELKREHGDPEGALQDFEKAAELSPTMPLVNLYRGRLMADTGKLRPALDTFNQVAKQLPENPDVYIDRARLRLRLGERQEAINDYWKGLRLYTEPDPLIFLELAETLVAEGNVTEALRALDEGVAKTGPQLKLEAYAVELELSRQNTNSALSRLDGITKHAFRKESWWAQKGDLLAQSERPAEALKAYEEAIKSLAILPPRLQQTPASVALKQRVNEAISRIKKM